MTISLDASAPAARAASGLRSQPDSASTLFSAPVLIAALYGRAKLCLHVEQVKQLLAIATPVPSESSHHWAVRSIGTPLKHPEQ
jgi:hypothetical protein